MQSIRLLGILRVLFGVVWLLGSLPGQASEVAGGLEGGSLVTPLKTDLQHQLEYAVMVGNPDELQRLLSEGADINAPSRRQSILTYASALGQLEIVEILVEHGAYVNLPSPDPKSGGSRSHRRNFGPYESAVWNNHNEVADYLLTHGADTNGAVLPPAGLISGKVLDEDQEPIKGIQVMISRKSDRLRGPWVCSPVDTDQNGEFRFTRLKPGAYRVSLPGQTAGPRDISVTEAEPRGKPLLLEMTSAEKRSHNFLRALEEGDLSTVRQLIEAGADVNIRESDGTTPLIRAAAGTNSLLIEILLEAGADIHAVDVGEKSAIDYATRRDREEIVGILLSKGSSPSTETLPPRGVIRGQVVDEDGAPLSDVFIRCFYQITNGNLTSYFRTDIQSGPDGSIEFESLRPQTYQVGMTTMPGVMETVVLEHRKSVVENIIVRTTRQTSLNQHLFHLPYPVDADVIRKFLEEGAEVDTRSESGETPLMSVSGAHQTDLAGVLLESGADVNATDSEGESALIHAIQRFRWHRGDQSMDILILLLDAGADVNAADKEGKSALWHAIYSENDTLIDFLRAHGAENPIAELPARGMICGVILDADDRPLPEAGLQFAKIAELGKKRSSGFGYKNRMADEHGMFKLRRLKPATYLLRSLNIHDLPQEIMIESTTSRVMNVVLHSSSEIETEQAMIEAARRGDIEAVNAALSSGAVVDAEDHHTGLTALYMAVSCNHLEIVSMLLAAGANMDPPTETRRPILGLAARKGYLKIAKILVEAGADLETTNFQGHTAMDEAVWKERAEVVEYLLSCGAKPSTRGARPLGIIRGQVLDEDRKPFVGIRLSVDYFKDPNGTSSSCRYGLRTDSEGRFERAGLSPGKYQIHIKGVPSSIKEVMLKQRNDVADPIVVQISRQDALDQDLIHAAIFGDLEEISRLLETGASITARNERGQTAFAEALSRDYVEAAHLLLSAGVDVDATDEQGWTVLMAAADRWNQGQIQLLLEMGAHPNITNRIGESALSRLTRRLNRWRKVEDGEVPDRVDANGNAWIKESKCEDCVRLLLEADADTEVRDSIGRTPLISVASGPSLEMVRLLLEAGADVSAEDNRGHSALWHAKRHKRVEIIRFLQEYGDGNATPVPASNPVPK